MPYLFTKPFIGHIQGNVIRVVRQSTIDGHIASISTDCQLVAAFDDGDELGIVGGYRHGLLHVRVVVGFFVDTHREGDVLISCC